jgi:hypothetical protein
MSKLAAYRAAFPVCFVLLASWAIPQSAPEEPRFIRYNEALPVLQSSKVSVPAELRSGGLNAETWTQWVETSDRAVRRRLEKGEEDTLTNLLRFGVTFTKEYRIDNAYLARYGKSDLVNSFANHRADDLVRALAAPGSNQGIHHMRLFLEKKGFTFATPDARAQVKAYLLANLARMRDECISYSDKLKSATVEEASELYADRGISLDTNLWPDFALHQQFQHMRDKGLLSPGAVRRVAIIGPGLDFANKESGSDFYPPQTTQPFAVIDSLAQLGLADPENLVLYTFDISPGVNVHLAQARRSAQAGQPYTVQLTWDQSVPRSAAYLSQFQPYWSALGTKIATPTPPRNVPAPLTSSLKTRAIKIHPKVVAKVTPLDMNIVYQRVTMAPEAKFDLVIGTNVFVYYGAFEQSLARANLAAMVKPGGFVLSNDLLADVIPSGLSEVLRRETQLSIQPVIVERMFCYRRDPE